MGADKVVPLVDVSPFFDKGGAAEARARAMEAMIEACRTYGFFRMVNHGVPQEVLSRWLELSAAFFALPDEEKAKVRVRPSTSTTPVPAGYTMLPSHSPDKHDYLITFTPRLGHNQYPAEPQELRQALEECHAKLAHLGMGLPPGFLRQYTGSDSSFPFLVAVHYFPATEEDAGRGNGLREHEDAEFITLLLQDHVGGLEVLMDGEWVCVEPMDGAIIVNMGDVMQVLTNKKLKSPTHRVVTKPGMHRHSFVYNVSVDSDKWIEPLPEFTEKVGEPPRYRGFPFGEYLQLRHRNKTHPPATPDEFFYTINHYAI